MLDVNAAGRVGNQRENARENNPNTQRRRKALGSWLTAWCEAVAAYSQ